MHERASLHVRDGKPRIVESIGLNLAEEALLTCRYFIRVQYHVHSSSGAPILRGRYELSTPHRCRAIQSIKAVRMIEVLMSIFLSTRSLIVPATSVEKRSGRLLGRLRLPFFIRVSTCIQTPAYPLGSTPLFLPSFHSTPPRLHCNNRIVQYGTPHELFFK